VTPDAMHLVTELLLCLALLGKAWDIPSGSLGDKTKPLMIIYSGSCF
jgi:hypothetical protein